MQTVQTGSLAFAVARSALKRFNSTRQREPHPLFPGAGEVVRFVEDMQSADLALSHAMDAADIDDFPSTEMEMLRRRRQSADAAVARQVTLAARRITSHRQEAIDILNSIFKLGSAPQLLPDGRYTGRFLTSTIAAPVDTFGQVMSRLYMPWLGKRFHAEHQTGDNVFSRSAGYAGRIFWPTYSDYRSYKHSLVTSFQFRTYVDTGVQDPEISTLKLDYDNPSNPRFIVRSVLDELVQISGNYYLGKAFLRRRGGSYLLAAFFALQKEV